VPQGQAHNLAQKYYTRVEVAPSGQCTNLQYFRINYRSKIFYSSGSWV
jgi:hypothetical protein